jgi:hypothetical protein
VNERIDTAYLLIAIMIAAAGYLIWRWRRHVARERRRLGGRQRY